MTYELKSAKEIEEIARNNPDQRAACLDYAKVKHGFLIERQKNFRARGWAVTITKIEAMHSAAPKPMIAKPAKPVKAKAVKEAKTMPPKTLAGIVESFLMQANATGQEAVRFYIGKAMFCINAKDMKTIKHFCKRISKLQKQSVQDFNPA